MALESPITSSALLRAKLDMYSLPLFSAFADLWARERQHEVVTSFLILLYQVMQSTVPLMECAVRRCRELQQDPLTPSLASYYSSHIENERDHDLWGLEDLQNAGFDSQTIASVMPSPEVAELAGAQYYWVLHHHPIMLLGYIMLLEAYPPSSREIDAIRDASGVPDTAFRTIRMHGELDLDHRARLDQFLDSLPLKEHHLDMISVSMLHATRSLAASVRAIEPMRWPEAGNPASENSMQ